MVRSILRVEDALIIHVEMEVINHQDGQEPALALNQKNRYLAHQENGPVDDHGPKHVDNQEGAFPTADASHATKHT